ncbi:integrase catalytic domain-containing protein [Trichonephila clavipes]|uniref:Integrase catalytic domain-containing protein n=1 Tax=Trichonephila clavipes TaxID=2585209 RepID=A0A8X6R8E7_TRICX|nr:integrase catalytic domain-containing protein [Trichonephila clavipes]
MPLRRFRRQYEQLSQFERGRIIDMTEAEWSARRVDPPLGCSDCVVRSPPIDASVWSGTAYEEIGLQQKGTRSSLATNPDSISAVMTIMLVCGDSRGERLNLAFALQRYTDRTDGVMVWGATAYNTRSRLVLIHCTMTAERYVHDILQPHVLPLMQWLTGAIFQQDNNRPLAARVSRDVFRTVTTLPWRGRFSDLSPFAHIWDHLGRRVGHPTSLNQLEARLHDSSANNKLCLFEKHSDEIHILLGSDIVGKLFTGERKISELWELDSLGIKDPSEKNSKLELQNLALKHFENTALRDDEGRLFDYEQVFVDWEKEGIIEKIVQDEPKNGGKFHYLLHRPVFKKNSTSKTRLVFDGSAHHGKSCSLNDCVEKGPNLIEIIPAILKRFRLGKIGVISDIRKAFLQISLHENDMNFLPFLWWEGAAVLNYHFKQAPEHLEKAAEKLKDSMYLDNCVASVDSSEELESFQRNSTELLALGKFDLRGWRHSDIESNSNFQDNQQKSDQQEIQVLRLMWNVKEDTFSISYRETESKEEVTKRRILSLAHRYFDPIRFTCPITLITELLIQECWKIETSWNSKLQIDIERKFEKLKNQLIELQDLKIPRRLSNIDFKDMDQSLQVFCDASKSSYARQDFRLPIIHPSNHPVVKALIICNHIQRFIAHRGRPSVIYSDNGTNFKGAYLLYQNVNLEKLKNVEELNPILWKFIHPQTPWRGGFWERLIGLVKMTLRKTLGKISLNHEEMYTVLCDCESLINSRPLTYVTDDVEDLEPLTPAMFLQDVREVGVPELDQIDENKLNKRLVYRNRIQNDLRKRFRVEYLGQLRDIRNIKGGNTLSERDIVLVRDDHTKRLKWNLGKTLKLYPGKDKKVRVAQVKTKFGSFLRPARKLYLLEVMEKNKSSVYPANSPLFSDAS